MSVKWTGHAGRKRVLRVTPFARPLFRSKNAVSFFAAFVLLINAAVPYWHAGQKAQAWAAAAASEHAHHAAMQAGAECPLHAAGSAEKKGGEEAPPAGKLCPLCQALQLFSPGVAQPSFVFLPCDGPDIAAFVPQGTELRRGFEIPEQGRPRAPPLA